MSLDKLSRQQKKILLFLHENHGVALKVIAARLGPRPPVNNPNSKSPYASIYRSVRGLARRGLVTLKQDRARGPFSVTLTPEGDKIAAQIRDDVTLAWKEWGHIVVLDQTGKGG